MPRSDGWFKPGCPGGPGRGHTAPAVEPDEVVVDLLVAGRYVGQPSASERLLAFQRLACMHLSANEIADRLGCSRRTVERYWKKESR